MSFTKQRSTMLTRQEKILAAIDLSTQLGIEIGPLNQPIVTRNMGNIRYIDHASTEDLKTKYAADPLVDTKQIVNIDYVWGSKSLPENDHIELEKLRHQLREKNAKIKRLRSRLTAKQQQIGALETALSQIQNSKFWQIKTYWSQLTQTWKPKSWAERAATNA